MKLSPLGMLPSGSTHALPTGKNRPGGEGDRQYSYNIGDRTPFQGELYGVNKAGQWILESGDLMTRQKSRAVIYTDCMSVLFALDQMVIAMLMKHLLTRSYRLDNAPGSFFSLA